MTDDPILLDTPPIRDQRSMVNVENVEDMHETPADVEAAWSTSARVHGLPIRRRSGDDSRDLHESRKHVQVYISAGKWIGSCPKCNGGIAGWPFNPRGACLDCGTIYRLDYPAQDEIEAAVALLARRPEQLRNWFPHLGETTADLEKGQDAALASVQQPGDKVVIDAADLERLVGPDVVEKLRHNGLVSETS